MKHLDRYLELVEAELVAAFRRGVQYGRTTNYPADRLSDGEILAKLRNEVGPCAACGSPETYGYPGNAGCRSCHAHDADA